MALLVGKDRKAFAVFGFVSWGAWVSLELRGSDAPRLQSREKRGPVVVEASEHLLGGLGWKLSVGVGFFYLGIHRSIPYPVTLLEEYLTDMVVG